jgi:hypothetical protein
MGLKMLLARLTKALIYSTRCSEQSDTLCSVGMSKPLSPLATYLPPPFTHHNSTTVIVLFSLQNFIRVFVKEKKKKREQNV